MATVGGSPITAPNRATDHYSGAPNERTVTLSTAYQPSASFATSVNVIIDWASAGTDIRGHADISADGSTGWKEVDAVREAHATGVAAKMGMSFTVPPGWYYRVVEDSGPGTPTATAQEFIL